MVSGVLREGEKLPSVRALAGQLAINPNTIQRAYEALEREGYVYSIGGKGSFVAPRREVDDGWEIIGAQLPAIVTVNKTEKEPRMATLMSKMAAALGKYADEARKIRDKFENIEEISGEYISETSLYKEFI